MAVVHLRFTTDGSDDEAWEIAEALESAAVARDYRAVSSWVESAEGAAPVSSAVTEVRHTGGQVTGVGDVDGDPVMVRRFGSLD